MATGRGSPSSARPGACAPWSRAASATAPRLPLRAHRPDASPRRDVKIEQPALVGCAPAHEEWQILAPDEHSRGNASNLDSIRCVECIHYLQYMDVVKSINWSSVENFPFWESN